MDPAEYIQLPEEVVAVFPRSGIGEFDAILRECARRLGCDHPLDVAWQVSDAPAPSKLGMMDVDEAFEAQMARLTVRRRSPWVHIENFTRGGDHLADAQRIAREMNVYQR